MSTKPPCRFYAMGTCTKGPSCPYSHGQGAKKQAYCLFYLQGTCKYGVRCELPHIKPGKPKLEQRNQTKTELKAYSASSVASAPFRKPWAEVQSTASVITARQANVDTQKKEELCPFAMQGICKYVEKCKYLHGLECPSCLKCCLHPDDSAEIHQGSLYFIQIILRFA